VAQLEHSPAERPAELDGGRRTIARLWRDAVSQHRPFPAYLVERDGGWQEVSWAEAGKRVDELAHGLLSLGVRKGDPFAILASTSLEWALFDFALALVGAIGAPVYANSSARDVAYIVEHSEAVGVLVEDEAQRAKIEAFRAGLPRVRHLLSFAELDGLAERGRAHAKAHPEALEAAAAAIREDDLFTYIYTSGTTGPPKGCVITHRNYFVMAEASSQVEGFTAREDVMLLYLPLAHNFGRLMHLLGPYRGFTLALLADPLRVADALAAVRPTVFPSVPRVYEKIYTAVLARLDEATGPRRRLVDWALDVGRRVGEAKQTGAQVPRGLALQHRLADRLVYGKVKARLGGRLRVGVSGGAPLAPEIAELFHALDILILEGYGLTECTTAATVNRPGRFRFGTVGLALPGVELRLADDGELLIRSPSNFAGYLKDEEATREILAGDGWLRTGDLATLDQDGFVTITDRKKDILVTAGGKNVAPQNLENDLKTSRYVSQALVVGDRRPYVAALVTLDAEEVGKWAGAHGRDTAPAALASDRDVVQLIQAAVDAVNADRSRYEQIKRFQVLPRDFSAEHDEVTPTMKLKRRVCQEHFAAEIEALYAVEGPGG